MEDVEVFSKLKDRDLLSKSDPLCVVYELIGRTTTNEQWIERGRTEMIKNSLNPEFARKIRLSYFFEERQFLRFEMYDVDSPSQKLDQQDFLGFAEMELAEVVSSGGLTRKLGGLSGNCGTVTVRADEDDANGAREVVQFWLRGEKLDKKDFFGKSDPFLNLHRMLDNGDRQLAHRTEVIKRTLNPEWRPFEVSLQELSGGEKSRPFFIECYDYDNDGGLSHDLIGTCQATVDDLDTKKITACPLINEKKRAKKGGKYKDSGVLHFNKVVCYRPDTFLDFIAGGTQLDFAVAIDFTASNGAVHSPSSLHYFSPNQPNQYEIALRAVLEICQHYNSSKRFDAYGFGAKNGQEDPSVLGVNGMMAAYRSTLTRVDLYGPTNFTPVIKVVAKKASKISYTCARYQILLIITDGVISDMSNTMRAIIEASGMPLSIIIVGVGNDEFESMDQLDSDDRLLSHQGWTAQRDIVQFVPLRNFLGSTGVVAGREGDNAMALLAKEVLAEVPLQVTSFMKSRNFRPRAPNDPWPRDPEPSPEELAAAGGVVVGQPPMNPTPYYPPAQGYSQAGYPSPVPGAYPPGPGYPNQSPYQPQGAPGYPPGPGYPAGPGYPNMQQTTLVQSAASAPPVDANDVQPQFGHQPACQQYPQFYPPVLPETHQRGFQY